MKTHISILWLVAAVGLSAQTLPTPLARSLMSSEVTTTAAANKIPRLGSDGKFDLSLIPTESLQIIARNGTDAERQTVVFANGELAWATDTKQLFIGDGTTLGGVSPFRLMARAPGYGADMPYPVSTSEYPEGGSSVAYAGILDRLTALVYEGDADVSTEVDGLHYYGPDGYEYSLVSAAGVKRGPLAVDLQTGREGAGQVASGPHSIAIGKSNTAPGFEAIAIGGGNFASDSAVAVGGGNLAGRASIAIGRESLASNNGIALGSSGRALGTGGVSFQGSMTLGTANMSFGNGYYNAVSGSVGSHTSDYHVGVSPTVISVARGTGGDTITIPIPGASTHYRIGDSVGLSARIQSFAGGTGPLVGDDYRHLLSAELFRGTVTSATSTQLQFFVDVTGYFPDPAILHESEVFVWPERKRHALRIGAIVDSGYVAGSEVVTLCAHTNASNNSSFLTSSVGSQAYPSASSVASGKPHELIRVSNGSVYAFRLDLIGSAGTGGNVVAVYRRQGVIRCNGAGSTSLLGAVQTIGTDVADSAASSWSIAVTANDTHDALLVQVSQGSYTAQAVNWAATLSLTTFDIP